MIEAQNPRITLTHPNGEQQMVEILPGFTLRMDSGIPPECLSRLRDACMELVATLGAVAILQRRAKS